MLDQITDQLAHLPGGWWLVLIVPLIGIIAKVAGHSSGVKDPVRMFSADQRRAGFLRAEQQCEMSTPWLTRCTRTAEHADHFFPHARGGASSMRNLVAACAPCNLRKSAHMPSRLLRWQIARRRRRYFPAELDRTPGEWFRG